MNNKLILIVLGIIALGGLTFLLSRNPVNIQNKSGKIQVVASFYPMYYFASKVGGEKAEVFNITPAAAEPHDYEPTTQDVVRINQRDRKSVV